MKTKFFPNWLRLMAVFVLLLAALAPAGITAQADEPVLAGGILSAYGDHTCALKPDGSVDCWGSAYNGGADDRPGPYTQVGVGLASTCALTLYGSVDCWGRDAFEQEAVDQPGPYTQLSSYYDYTCALRPDGSIDCWQVFGNGQVENQPGSYIQVSAGSYYACALTTSGAVDCWGNNGQGQAEDQPGPYTQVSSSDTHTCALKPDGSVDCWGRNDLGQAEDQPGPYTWVSAGVWHTCALKPDGSIDCWGYNIKGQAEDQPGPYTQVSAGVANTCALTPSGAVDCWGDNYWGQSTDQPGPYGAYACMVTTNADSGAGSLREKIANTVCGTITFDDDYTITLASQLTIARNMTVDGTGHSVIISGNDAVRVFQVNPGVTFNLSNLTVAHGHANVGGGIANQGGALNVVNSTFESNTATVLGGGIFNNNGTVNIANSTFDSNTTAGFGGGIYTAGATNITNSAFSGNRATQYDSKGGGIYTSASALNITNSTLSGNSAPGGGGGIANKGDTATFRNTIVANNAGSNCEYAITDGGNNLVWGDTTCPGINADPKLAPLGDYGGATQTFALLPGSAAIDAGDDSVCPATDQRGIARPQGAHCDIGAYESEAIADTTPPVITPDIQGTLGQNGWYVSDVSLSWTVVDEESDITSTTGCDPVSITSDQPETTYTCTATSAGGTSNVSASIKRDATAPSVSVTPDREADYGGWYNHAVNFTVSGSDELSGIVSCTAPFSYSSPESAAASVSGTCMDQAGNEGNGSFSFQYDATTPVLVPSVSPNPVVLNGSATANPNATDSLSGIESSSCDAVITSTVGSHTLSCAASDNAGNTHSQSVTYEVVATFPTSAVLDNFNRANGKVGSNWAISDQLMAYKIANQRLDVQLGGALLWKPTSFDINQEAFVTLSVIDSHSPTQGLILKAQSSSRTDAGVILVVYDARTHAVRVSTLRMNRPIWTNYGNIPATFANGDQLGARALANGTVEIYQNGTLIATVTLSAQDQAFFNSRGGRIGLWTLAAPNAVLDDFGGGNVTP